MKRMILLLALLTANNVDAGHGHCSSGGYTSYGAGSYGVYHGYGSGTYTRSLYGTGYFGGSWVGGGRRGVSFEHDPPPPMKWDEKLFEQIEVPEGMKKELMSDGTYYFRDKE